MNISSVVVSTYPHETENLRKKLSDLAGVDVHEAMEDGRIIITIEDTPANIPSDTLMNVQNMSGVLSAAMVYNYSDEQLNQTDE